MSKGILVFAEQREGKLNRVSYEAVVAGQRFAAALNQPLSVVLPGSQVGAIADELAAKKVDAVYTLDNPNLEHYTPDGFSIAMRQAVEQLQPYLVLFSHTYLVRDFAPKLTASLGKAFIADCVSYRL